MINKKNIDWTRVTGCTYDTEKYLRDIPLLKLVSHYVELNSNDETIYIGEFKLNNCINKVVINSQLNEGYLNDNLINPELLIEMFAGEDVDPAPIIYELTGVDLDDYIEEIR